MKEKIVASGKRKRSKARAVIYEGTGEVTVNKISYKFLPEIHRLIIEEPLRIAKEVLGNLNYNIEASWNGGGVEAGIEACRLAIARALIKATKSKKLEQAFRKYDRSLVVADTRIKEAYKPNDSKARAKRQKSYR